MIYEADHALAALADSKRGTWCYTIVADEVSGLKVREVLPSERLDVNFVEIDRDTGSRIGIGCEWFLGGWNRQREIEGVVVGRTAPGDLRKYSRENKRQVVETEN